MAAVAPREWSIFVQAGGSKQVRAGQQITRIARKIAQHVGDAPPLPSLPSPESWPHRPGSDALAIAPAHWRTAAQPRAAAALCPCR